MPRIIPRSEWTKGLANPSAGKPPAWMYGGTSPRVPLRRPCSHLVVHYAGVPDNPAPDNQFLSQTSLTYMRNMFMWAHTNTTNKVGDEYNWVIAGPGGDLYEWAGEYRAAHCSNWNTDSVGVQFGLDVNDVPPLEFAVRLLELRRFLVDRGDLTPDHRVGQHREYLDTSPGPTWKPKTGNWATDCPGPLVTSRWALYDTPLPAPEPPPPPVQTPTPRSPSMLVICTDHPSWPGTGVVFDMSARDRVPPELYYDVLVPAQYAPANPLNLPHVAWDKLKNLV